MTLSKLDQLQDTLVVSFDTSVNESAQKAIQDLIAQSTISTHRSTMMNNTAIRRAIDSHIEDASAGNAQTLTEWFARDTKRDMAYKDSEVLYDLAHQEGKKGTELSAKTAWYQEEQRTMNVRMEQAKVQALAQLEQKTEEIAAENDNGLDLTPRYPFFGMGMSA